MALQRSTRFFLFVGGIYASLLLSFVITPSFASAATVLSVCSQGCGFTTIQSAIDAIPADLSQSYTIEIRDSGRYEESLRISGKKTSADRTITLRAMAGTTPTIVSSAYTSALDLHYQGYVIVDGLHFSGGLRARAGGISLDGASNNVIRNNRFSEFHKASMVVVYGGNDNTIENNIFEKSVGAAGVNIYYYNGGNIVRENTFINVQKGVILGNRIRANTITNNTFLLDGGGHTAISIDVDLGRAQLSRINENQYYLARGATLSRVQGVAYSTLSEWQAATGFDRESSIITTPSHPAFVPWSEVVKTVCLTGCDYATLQSAVEGIPSDVPGVGHELITRNVSYRIEVRDAGPYDGGLRISVITDADHTLTIAAAPGVRPMIRQAPYQRGMEIRYSSYVTLKGFWFPGGYNTNFFGGPIGVEGGMNNTIEDMLIENTPEAPGIVLHGGDGHVVRNNMIRGTSRGVFMFYFSYNHRIEGNTIADTFNAIFMNDRTSGVQIVNNTFFHNKRGIEFGDKRAQCTDTEDHAVSCNYTVRNTIFVGDGSESSAFVFARPESESSLTSDYNLFYTINAAGIAKTSTAQYPTLASWQGQGNDAHSVFGDPLFAESNTPPYDFHVQSKGGRYTANGFVIDLAHSPAIDAGDPANAFDRELSLHGNRVNIGAYGNTAQASKSVAAALPTPPSVAPILQTTAWVDTAPTDWETAQKTSTTVVGSGIDASVTLAAQSESWTTVVLGIQETIGNVAFTNGSDGFAVGSNGTILRWNGSAWSAVASGTSANLWSVALPNGNGFAVGSNGTILRWNGSAWSVVASGTTEHLLALSMVSMNDGWAVGTNGTILRWNGSSWSVVASGTTKTLNAIFMTSATNGWIVGNGGTILRWNGSSWSVVASGTTNALLSVHERPDGSVIVIGDGGFIARYAQGAWATHTPLTNGALLSMTFFSDGRGWIVGESGIILETANGTSWTIAQGPQSTEAFFATAITGNTQWVMGTNGASFSIQRFSEGEGSVISRVFDAGVSPQWKTIGWGGVAGTGTTVRLQFATSMSVDGPWNFVGPDNTAQSFYTTAESTIASSHNGYRFARYQLLLQRSGDAAAPIVHAITLRYEYDSSGSPLSPTVFLPRNTMLVNGGTLTWSSIPGGTSYEVMIARDSGFTQTVFSTSVSNALSLTMPQLDDGTYVWRIRVTTPQGQSPWSETQSFILDRTAPAAPTLSMPPQQATVFATPSFGWSVVPGAAYYQLQIALNANFASPLIDIPRTLMTNFNLSFPLQNGNYGWRVRSYDRAGNSSIWSEGQFVVSAIEPPPTIAPPLIAPANNVTTNAEAVTLRWEPIPGATSYTVVISADMLFRNSVLPDTNVNTNELTWNVSVPDGPYYWRVRGVNAGGYGPWSSEQSITLDRASPPSPEIQASVATIVSVPATPTFSWEPVPDAVTYTLEVGSRRQEDIVATSFTFAEPLDTGTYLWRVQGVDAVGNTGEWAVSSLTVVPKGTRPPDPPPEVQETPQEQQKPLAPKIQEITTEQEPEKQKEITQSSEQIIQQNNEQQPLQEQTASQPSSIPSIPSSPAVEQPTSPTLPPSSSSGIAPPSEPVAPEPTSFFAVQTLAEAREVVASAAIATIEVTRRVAEKTVETTVVVAEITERAVKKAEPVATPALTVVAPIAIAMNPVTAAGIPALPGMATHAFSWLFSALGLKRKRKAPWGMVYDAITKEPIGLAIVRLFNTATQQLVATEVTDKEGRFEFLVPLGTYTVQVQKTPYRFPSSIVGEKNDGDIADVYHGETITVSEQGQAMRMNIALDPEDPSSNRSVSLLARLQRVRSFVAKASLPILIFGTMVSVVFYAFSRTQYNLFVLLVYVAFAAYHTVLSPKKMKSWGTIFDATTLQPVPLATVSIIDPAFQRVIKTRLSDYEGRFTFLPDPGTYELKVTKQQYIFPGKTTPITTKYRHFYRGGPLTIEKKKAIITADIPLDPVRSSPPIGPAGVLRAGETSNGVDPASPSV